MDQPRKPSNHSVDNIYVGHSTADAENLAKETYHVKKAIEKEAEGSLDDEEDEDSMSLLDKTQLKVYEFIRKCLLS